MASRSVALYLIVVIIEEGEGVAWVGVGVEGGGAGFHGSGDSGCGILLQ